MSPVRQVAFCSCQRFMRQRLPTSRALRHGAASRPERPFGGGTLVRSGTGALVLGQVAEWLKAADCVCSASVRCSDQPCPPADRAMGPARDPLVRVRSAWRRRPGETRSMALSTTISRRKAAALALIGIAPRPARHDADHACYIRHRPLGPAWVLRMRNWSRPSTHMSRCSMPKTRMRLPPARLRR